MNKSELIEHIAKNADINKAQATRARRDYGRHQADIGATLEGKEE